MYQVSPHRPEIRLVWRDGSFVGFPSVLAAAQYARAAGLLGRGRVTEVGDAYGPVRSLLVREGGLLNGRLTFEWCAYPPNVICRTEHGELVPVDELFAAVRVIRTFRFSWWREQRPEDYRCAPVPGIHTRGRRKYYRHPKTRCDLEAQARYVDELRDEHLDPAQVGRIRKIVTAWDDVSRNLEKGWKRHRRTQYRE